MRSKQVRPAVLSAVFAAAFGAGAAQAELPIEPASAVKTLPQNHPSSYVYVVDPNFFGIESGKVVIVDVGAETDHHKGILGAAQFGNFAAARTRPEIYVAETFYSRGQRGDRTDVLTIYDKASLDAIGEIVLPDGKRAQLLTESGAFQLSADERFAFLYNFTPASSVTVIDLVKRRVASEIDLPGCLHAFPLKGGGFASLCGNGGVVSTRLDASGKAAGQAMSEPFSDIVADPMFTRPAVIDGVGYFPTYHGRIQPIDFNGAEAVVGEAFAIPEPATSASGGSGKDSKGFLGIGKRKKPKGGPSGSGKYLPSGWQLTASDDAGRLYLLMRETETIDDHDTGGDEVWVIDPKAKTAVNRLKLAAPSQIIEVTAGPDPYLVAVNPDMSLNVHKAATGEFVRRIGGQIVMTPFAAFASK